MKKLVDAALINRLSGALENFLASQPYLTSAFGHAFWCGCFASAVCSPSNSVASPQYPRRHEPLDLFDISFRAPRRIAATTTLAAFMRRCAFSIRIFQI
jgi:hypothetical protein